MVNKINDYVKFTVFLIKLEALWNVDTNSKRFKKVSYKIYQIAMLSYFCVIVLIQNYILFVREFNVRNSSENLINISSLVSIIIMIVDSLVGRESWSAIAESIDKNDEILQAILGNLHSHRHKFHFILARMVIAVVVTILFIQTSGSLLLVNQNLRMAIISFSFFTGIYLFNTLFYFYCWHVGKQLNKLKSHLIKVSSSDELNYNQRLRQIEAVIQIAVNIEVVNQRTNTFFRVKWMAIIGKCNYNFLIKLISQFFQESVIFKPFLIYITFYLLQLRLMQGV